jgi:hypothetical protein
MMALISDRRMGSLLGRFYCGRKVDVAVADG